VTDDEIAAQTTVSLDEVADRLRVQDPNTFGRLVAELTSAKALALLRELEGPSK